MTADVRQKASLKERQRQERERLILEATGELLAEKGYDAISMEEIASRVGISRTAIYLHFPSKEELVLALLRRSIETSAERLDALLAEKMSAREKVRTLIERSYSAVAQPTFQAFMTVMQSPSFLSKATEKEVTMQDMRDLWKPTEDRLTVLLEDGKRSGDFDSDMPTTLMVRLLATLLSPFTKHMFEQEQMPLDAIVPYLCRYFLKGIAADQPGETAAAKTFIPCPDVQPSDGS